MAAWRWPVARGRGRGRGRGKANVSVCQDLWHQSKQRGAQGPARPQRRTLRQHEVDELAAVGGDEAGGWLGCGGRPATRGRQGVQAGRPVDGWHLVCHTDLCHGQLAGTQCLRRRRCRRRQRPALNSAATPIGASDCSYACMTRSPARPRRTSRPESAERTSCTCVRQPHGSSSQGAPLQPPWLMPGQAGSPEGPVRRWEPPRRSTWQQTLVALAAWYWWENFVKSTAALRIVEG